MGRDGVRELTCFPLHSKKHIIWHETVDASNSSTVKGVSEKL
jgi:hypothetical protein